MKTRKPQKSGERNPEQEIYRRIMKGKTDFTNLLLKNLLRTNQQLLKSLDVSNSVLF